MRRTFVILLAVITAVSMLLTSCSSPQKNSSAVTPGYAENTYVNKSNGNDISIEYPSFGNDKADSAFKLFAENFLYTKPMEFDFENTVYTAKYTVKLKTKDYISVRFEGYINPRTAAYPSRRIVGLTVRLSDGNVMNMDNVVSINQTEFVDIFVKNAREQISPEITSFIFPNEVLAQADRENIFKELDHADFYLTESSLVVLYEVIHAQGDYIEVAIPREQLGNMAILKW